MYLVTNDKEIKLSRSRVLHCKDRFSFQELNLLRASANSNLTPNTGQFCLSVSLSVTLLICKRIELVFRTVATLG